MAGGGRGHHCWDLAHTRTANAARTLEDGRPVRPSEVVRHWGLSGVLSPDTAAGSGQARLVRGRHLSLPAMAGQP